MEIEWSELCPVSSVTVMIYESYPRDALKLEWQLIGRIARNLLSIVTNVFSRRMECGWLLNRLNADSPISFSLHARESSVQASDKWYLIKLYCANNDHNAFGSTRPDFYSSILDNWYFRGHEASLFMRHRTVQNSSVFLFKNYRSKDLDIHPNNTDSSRMKSVN